MFVYGLSSVSGQEAMVSIPIVVGESLTVHHITVPNMAQTFCPRVMTPTAQPAPPGNPPVAAPPTAAIQLSISSPPAPGDPLSFNTSTLTAAPGAQVTLTYTNDSNQPHNWHLYNGPGPSSPSIVETRTMTGPGAVDTAHFTAPTQAGSYFFRCDVHPTVMTGNLVVGGTP
jgi:plastocyanin